MDENIIAFNLDSFHQSIKFNASTGSHAAFLVLEGCDADSQIYCKLWCDQNSDAFQSGHVSHKVQLGNVVDTSDIEPRESVSKISADVVVPVNLYDRICAFLELQEPRLATVYVEIEYDPTEGQNALGYRSDVLSFQLFEEKHQMRSRANA